MRGSRPLAGKPCSIARARPGASSTPRCRRAIIDAPSARALMLDQPSVIKRPVVGMGRRAHHGAELRRGAVGPELTHPIERCASRRLPSTRPPIAVVPRAAATTLVLRDGAQGVSADGEAVGAGSFIRAPAHLSRVQSMVPMPTRRSTSRMRCWSRSASGRATGVGERAKACAVAALRECREECAHLGSARALGRGVAGSRRWVWASALTRCSSSRAPRGQVPRASRRRRDHHAQWVAPR